MQSKTSRFFQATTWTTLISGVLLFWLGATIVLDFVVMPTLYASGMMTAPGFTAAGYTLFGCMNRLELLGAGLVMTGILVATFAPTAPPWLVLMPQWRFPAIAFAAILVGIAFTCTYVLTPIMSGLGLSLDALNTSMATPVNMDLWHGVYWLFEATKLSLGIGLLRMVGHRAAPAPQVLSPASSSW